MRCKQPKVYSFCGAHTIVSTQWFFDSKLSRCLPYKYCLDSNEISIPDDSVENRFENEIQCEFVCTRYGLEIGRLLNLDILFCRSKRLDSVGKKAMIKNFKMMRVKSIKGTFANRHKKRNPLVIKKEMLTEIRDPSRCMRPKTYSFCGSQTTPRTHWYYSKEKKRCLPYAYCESVQDLNDIHRENNFFSERLCLSLCNQLY